MRKLLMIIVTFSALLLLGSTSLYSQGQTTPTVPDKDLELLRKDLRSGKKQIIEINLQLTEAEATKFWPIYDQYTAESGKIYDARYELIKEYAATFRGLTDAQAASLAARYINSDDATVKLRQKYFPIFAKAISGRKTALFFQLDRRIGLMIDLQLASEIPLVQP